MNLHFEDKSKSERQERSIPVDERDEDSSTERSESRLNESRLSTADVASAGERIPPRTREAGVEVEPQSPEGTPSGPDPGETHWETNDTPLFSTEETRDFRSRWNAIQVGFVDEPRQAVQQADNLVAAAIQRLAQVFAEEKSKLESQFKQGDNVSTEDLRLALQHYRSFFSRLLSV
jgi:hypothetical protein